MFSLKVRKSLKTQLSNILKYLKLEFPKHFILKLTKY